MNKFMTFCATAKNAFENDESKFLGFQRLLHDATVNKCEIEGFSKKEVNDKIVSTFRAAIGCDENSSVKEVRRAIRRNQNVIFDLIEETLDNLMVTGWQNDPFCMQYVDVRNIALGDKNSFYIEDDSMLSVMEVSGSNHDIIRQRLGAGSTVSISTHWVALKIYAEAERLMTNVEDWGGFISKVYEAYDYYLKQTIYDTMVGYKDKIAATYKKTGSVTADTLRDLCETIEMVTGSKVVIMGTRTALRKVTALQNASYISNEMKQEHYTSGTLGIFEGYTLVEIPQGFKHNDLTQKLVANDVLWIMPVESDKFIKVVYEGDAQVTQVTDAATNMDMTASYEVMQKLGIGVLFNKCFGIYAITA